MSELIGRIVALSLTTPTHFAKSAKWMGHPSAFGIYSRRGEGMGHPPLLHEIQVTVSPLGRQFAIMGTCSNSTKVMRGL